MPDTETGQMLPARFGNRHLQTRRDGEDRRLTIAAGKSADALAEEQRLMLDPIPLDAETR